MPNRILREGILTSERVNGLSMEAELFYRRLMSVVDDYGRYFANTTLLRTQVYPLRPDLYSGEQIGEFLNECAQQGLLLVYTHNGKRYLEYTDFNQRARYSSKFPPPGDRPVSVERPPASIHGQPEGQPEIEDGQKYVHGRSEDGPEAAHGQTSSVLGQTTARHSPPKSATARQSQSLIEGVGVVEGVDQSVNVKLGTSGREREAGLIDSDRKELAEALRKFSNSEFGDPPAGVLHAIETSAAGAPVSEIVELFRRKYFDGYKPGKTNGPKGWPWFVTVAKNHFQQRANRSGEAKPRSNSLDILAKPPDRATARHGEMARVTRSDMDKIIGGSG